MNVRNLYMKSSPLLRNFCSYYRFVNKHKIDVAEPRVQIYKSKRFSALLEGSNENFSEKITNSPALTADFASILPVTAAGALIWKNGKFVINLSLLPKSRSLEAKFLTPAGVATKIVHLENLALITLDDFNIRYTLYSPFHDDIIDREMVYSNRLEGEDWLFDAQGEWDEAGVNHPELSLEKNLQERQNYFNITDAS